MNAIFIELLFGVGGELDAASGLLRKRRKSKDEFQLSTRDTVPRNTLLMYIVVVLWLFWRKLLALTLHKAERNSTSTDSVTSPNASAQTFGIGRTQPFGLDTIGHRSRQYVYKD